MGPRAIFIPAQVIPCSTRRTAQHLSTLKDLTAVVIGEDRAASEVARLTLVAAAIAAATSKTASGTRMCQQAMAEASRLSLTNLSCRARALSRPQTVLGKAETMETPV